MCNAITEARRGICRCVVRYMYHDMYCTVLRQMLWGHAFGVGMCSVLTVAVQRSNCFVVSGDEKHARTYSRHVCLRVRDVHCARSKGRVGTATLVTAARTTQQRMSRASSDGAAARDKAEPRTAWVQRSRAAPSAASCGCRQPGQLYQLVGSRWRRSIPLAARLCAEAVAAKQRAAPQFAASQPAQRFPGRRHGCARLYRRLKRQAVPCGGPRCTFGVCCALRRVLCFGTVSSMTDWSALAS